MDICFHLDVTETVVPRWALSHRGCGGTQPRRHRRFDAFGVRVPDLTKAIAVDLPPMLRPGLRACASDIHSRLGVRPRSCPPRCDCLEGTQPYECLVSAPGRPWAACWSGHASQSGGDRSGAGRQLGDRCCHRGADRPSPHDQRVGFPAGHACQGRPPRSASRSRWRCFPTDRSCCMAAMARPPRSGTSTSDRLIRGGRSPSTSARTCRAAGDASPDSRGRSRPCPPRTSTRVTSSGRTWIPSASCGTSATGSTTSTARRPASGWTAATAAWAPICRGATRGAAGTSCRSVMATCRGRTCSGCCAIGYDGPVSVEWEDAGNGPSAGRGRRAMSAEGLRLHATRRVLRRGLRSGRLSQPGSLSRLRKKSDRLASKGFPN